MAVDAGTIEYDVITDTSSQLKAEKVVDKTTKAMERDFSRIDKSSKKTGTSLTRSSQAVTNSFRLQKGAAQQLGFQLQDVAVQAQMGVSAFTILGQQGSQVAGVFGPGGALFGAAIAVAAAIGGVLFKALGSAADNTETLNERMKELIKTTTLTAEQSRVLIAAEADSSKEKAKLIAANQEEIDSLRSRIKLGQQTIKNYDEETETYKNLKQGIETLTSELDLQIASQQTLTKEIEASNKKIETFSALTGDKAVTATKDQRDALEELIKSLRQETEILGLSERGVALRTAELLKATPAEIALINASFDKIDAYKEEIAVEKERQASMDSTLAALDRMFDAEERLSDQASARAAALAERVITRGLSEPDRLSLELDQLRALRKKGALDFDLFEKARTAIVKQQSDARDKIREKEQQNEQMRNNLILSSSAQFFDAAAGLTKSFSGEQSKAYKVLFGISKAFSIAQATLNLSTAISQASVLPFPANVPAMAQAASSGAALLGAIQGATFGGAGRQFGGGIAGGQVRQIGEQGRPEIFTNAQNKSFMMDPGGGRVTPMDKVGGGTVNNINIVTEPGMVAEQSNVPNETGGVDMQVVIRSVAADMRTPGSQTNRAMQASTTATPRLSGQRRN